MKNLGNLNIGLLYILCVSFLNTELFNSCLHFLIQGSFDDAENDNRVMVKAIRSNFLCVSS